MVVAAGPRGAIAQDAGRGGGRTPTEAVIEQQRRADDRLADQRRSAAPVDSLLDVQYGGWIEHYSFHFDDGIQTSRALHRPSFVLWSRVSLDRGTHEFFARTRMTYEYYNEGDEFDLQEDHIGPNLERGWYQVNVGRALGIWQPSDPWDLSVKVGRQSVVFGTGYALDLPVDGVTFSTSLHDVRFRGLFSRTLPSFPNIDSSEPVNGDGARRLFGFEVSYEGWENHRPFAYALWNDDFTNEVPNDPLQNYAYDSQYWGFGIQGELARNLAYWAEGVFETGQSFGDGDFIRRDDIQAWGWDVGFEYFWDIPVRPRISAEYMFASGDADRFFSPTNAFGGNTSGLDQSFIGFGYRDTGIAFAPALSNLHVFRLGGSVLPFREIEQLREFELGTNWFLYLKHHRFAAISDPTADLNDHYVGWEMDYFANWRIASDLSWTVRWGVFFPGDAFSDTDARHFVFSGVTWSF